MKDWSKVYGWLLAAIIVLLLITVYNSYQATHAISKGKGNLPVITITSITASCSQCPDISAGVAQLKQSLQGQITEESVDWQEAQDLIDRYQIQTVPAIIVHGAALQGLRTVNNASVFESPAPHIAVASGEVRGIVRATILSVECDECTSMNGIVAELRNAGIYLDNVAEVVAESEEGQALIRKHGVKRLPTILLSSDVAEYPAITQVWPQVGVVQDGVYVLEKVPPPYMEGGNVRGLVGLTIVKDESCADCYNASLHQVLLENNFGMKFSTVEVLDVSSTRGMQTVNKYGITLVPTFILDNQAGSYDLLAQVWEQVGDIGHASYVFRRVDELGGVYKNLTSGEIINATQ